MGCYGWQHVFLVKPVDPLWALRGADILAPAVVRVRPNAVDRDDTEAA